MAMHEKPSIIVGFESCIDLQADLSMAVLQNLARATKSGLNRELKEASGALSRGEDGEIAADGKNLSALISEIKAKGAKIKQKLGGNAALESSQFITLGSNVFFIGNFFRAQRKMLSKEAFFEKTDFGFAHESEKNPVSLVFQRKNARFIICDGSGRRIDDLRKRLSSLPETIRAAQKNRKIDALCLPSWHALFANGISKKEAENAKNIIREIRNLGVLTFTDTGSFKGLKDEDVSNLWQIYGAFDIIGMNEFEFERLCKVVGIRPKGAHYALSKLLEKSKADTIWLHTAGFQTSISKKFPEKMLRDAEENAAAAGALHVESGEYPDFKKITERKSGKKTGKCHAEKTEERHMRGKADFACVQSYCLKRIKSEVGAGDISAATFLWSLIKDKR